jgi:hypothetical protein
MWGNLSSLTKALTEQAAAAGLDVNALVRSVVLQGRCTHANFVELSMTC